MSTTAASRARTILERVRFGLRNRLVKNVDVQEDSHSYRFRCENPVETWRARTLLEKEEGTVRWIRAEVRDGDVFYDIGANIGLYTLMAARRVGAGGMVYAFEPHVANLNSLLHNVGANGLGGGVKVLSCALNDVEGFFDFHYAAWVAGSSMSQLNDARDDRDEPFRPVFSELKFAATVDSLVAAGVIRGADHVKIDVDGNELLVLKGMERLLTGGHPPRTIQVEINARSKDALFRFLRERGYEAAERHDTLAGKRKLAAGRDPESVSYNMIFRPAGVRG